MDPHEPASWPPGYLNWECFGMYAELTGIPRSAGPGDVLEILGGSA